MPIACESLHRTLRNRKPRIVLHSALHISGECVGAFHQNFLLLISAPMIIHDSSMWPGGWP